MVLRAGTPIASGNLMASGELFGHFLPMIRSACNKRLMPRRPDLRHPKLSPHWEPHLVVDSHSGRVCRSHEELSLDDIRKGALGMAEE
jgi:hypothetical protein